MKKPLLLGIILTVCIVIVAFVFAQVYPVGMISYWKFDEDPGPTAFDSADANHGTINGATRTTGQVGGALSFDGFNDCVDVPNSDSLDITSDLTLEAWIEPNSVSYAAQGEVIGKWVAGDASYWFAIRDGHLQMRISATGSDYYNIEETDNDNISIDNWYHVVGVYDASEQDIKLYINGVVEESTTVRGTIPSSIHSGSANVKIGGWWPGYYFEGKIDEAAIYNRALSAEEIQHHYQDGLHGLGYDVECVIPPDDMVSWWPGDRDGVDIWDANHGTLWNGATYAAGRVNQAFSFDGVDDYVEVADADNLDITNELTIDAWFYNTGTTDMSWQRILHKNYRRNYEMWITNSTRLLSFRISDGIVANAKTLSSVAKIQFDIWYHVAAVYDGLSMKLYLNGDLSNSMSTTAIKALGITSDPVIIGNVGTDISSFNHNRPFNGLIDEVEIFNRALSASEIQAIYLAGSAGKCKVTNQPPVAVCKDIEIPVVENCKSASITAAEVDGGSYDPDDDPITLSIDDLGPFSLGGHPVNLTVTDNNGASNTCLAIVTVVDETPPIIESFTVDPNILRPPNHKMVLITPTIIASDNCDLSSELEVVLISITMDEGDEEDTYNPILDETLGDGHTTNDMQVIDGKIYLRAERSGKGDGRIYTITYTATDESGNSATATAKVTVPHDKR